MTTLTLGPLGQVALPEDIRERYGVGPETPIRVIETRSGILLIPLTNDPINDDLAQELSQWQLLSTEALDMFPYEDKD